MRIEHPTDKANFSIVHLDDYSVAFSYETAIGFIQLHDIHWTVRENDWSNTTGKHLNWLNDDKASRISGSKFEELLSKLVSADEWQKVQDDEA